MAKDGTARGGARAGSGRKSKALKEKLDSGKADKEKSTEKIDGAVATIMALDRAIRCGNDNRASVYDERGLLFI